MEVDHPRPQYPLAGPLPACGMTELRARDTVEAAHGALAQLGERLDRTQEVSGSNPLCSTSVKPRLSGAFARVEAFSAPWMYSRRERGSGMDTMAHGERRELLERGVELDVIRAGAEAVAAGEGRAIVVEGPAGIGKTALVAAARACADEAGLKPLGARATELERTFGYGVVRQLLEPAVHDGAGTAVFEGAARYTAALLDVPLAEPASLPLAPEERSPSCTASTASRSTSPTTSHWRCWWTTHSGPTARRCGSWRTSQGGSATRR